MDNSDLQVVLCNPSAWDKVSRIKVGPSPVTLNGDWKYSGLKNFPKGIFRVVVTITPANEVKAQTITGIATYYKDFIKVGKDGTSPPIDFSYIRISTEKRCGQYGKNIVKVKAGCNYVAQVHVLRFYFKHSYPIHTTTYSKFRTIPEISSVAIRPIRAAQPLPPVPQVWEVQPTVAAPNLHQAQDDNAKSEERVVQSNENTAAIVQQNFDVPQDAFSSQPSTSNIQAGLFSSVGTRSSRHLKRKNYSNGNAETCRPKVKRDAKKLLEEHLKEGNQTHQEAISKAQEHVHPPQFSDVIKIMRNMRNKTLNKKSAFFNRWNTSVSALERNVRGKKHKGHRDICEKIHKIFNSAIVDPKKRHMVAVLSSTYDEVKRVLEKIMKDNGFCCGNSFNYSMSNVICNEVDECRIGRGQQYRYKQYETSDGLMEVNYCLKHHASKPTTIILGEQPNEIKLKKNAFNTACHLEKPEEFVECSECKKEWHMICAGIGQDEKESFKCTQCSGFNREMVKVSAESLKPTGASRHIQKRLNDFLRNKAGLITVRELYANRKDGEVKELMKKYYLARKMRVPEFKYFEKFIAAFREINGQEVMFFAMIVQEYESPKDGWVNVAWLDSVKYFQPENLKTDVYKKILLSYFEYAASVGFRHAHIWASAPKAEGDDYIFNVHPFGQQYPDQKHLQKWYCDALEDGRKSGIVASIQNEFMDFENSNMDSILKFLYFEGGFWKDKLEKIIFYLPENYGDDELKEKIVACSAQSKNKLFYINFPNIPTTKNEDVLIENSLANNREDWLYEQAQNNLNFGTLREAHYSTQMLINRNQPCCSSSNN